MMLGIIQILFAAFMTYFYTDKLGLSFVFWDVVKVVFLFVLFNIIYFLIILLLFVIFIYTTEKIDSRKLWKHKMAGLINKYAFSFLYRVNLKILGKENLPKDKNFVVYSNHIEYTDPLYIMQAYNKSPLAFVAKEPLFKYPVLKNLLLGMGCIPISRFADRSAMNTIVKAIKQVRNGLPMGIFPEGKRTYKNELIEYRPGAFKLAIKAKADISPVCVFDMHKLSKKYRLWPTKVYVKILPIIKYEDYKDKDSNVIAKEVYDLTNEALEEFKASK